MMQASQLSQQLHELGDAEEAKRSQRFFKTEDGAYGAGDLFLGIRMPVIRQMVKQHPEISIQEIHKLLKSCYHEERLCALLFLVSKYKKGSSLEKAKVYQFYLSNTRWINNWDLVDCSAYFIVGPHLERKDKAPLFTLARSENLWERRIAMVATLHLIRKKQFEATLELAKLLINDPEDLMHKAVGWMLKEVGKRDFNTGERFLKKRYKKMPRTMLRYAIEKFPETKRKAYLNGEI